jgi:hypothetical protein
MTKIGISEVNGFSSMKFYKSSKNIKVIAVILLGLALPAWAKTPHQKTDSPIYYNDCAAIEFDDVDESKLTKQELIARMDMGLEDTLNNSEECMRSAANAGSQRFTGAGGGSQGTGSGQSTGIGSQGSAQQTDAQQSQNTASSVSVESQKGPSKGGSSAVCDTVKQGLAAATNEQENELYKGLMKEYNCK